MVGFKPKIHLELLKLDYNLKKQFSLGGRLAIGFFFIILSGILLVSGFLDLDHYENIKEEPKTQKIETRSVDSHPQLFWLLSYDMNLEPHHSNFLQADEKIRIHIFANSKQLMNDFEVHVFHEDLLETYSDLLESYLHGNSKFPKLKNEWTSYAVLEINDATKCDITNDDNSISRRNDCFFDYNAFNNHIFVNPGKYHVLFVTNLENGSKAGYLEQTSMFSLKDPFTVDLSNKMESMVTLTESQQKLNFRAEGLSLIGIGIAMIIGSMAIFDSFVNAKRRFNDIEKEEEKRIYLEKMLVATLARTREQIKKTNEVLLKENAVTEHVVDEWAKLKVPAERLETLIIIGTDVVNHKILDDADLVKGSISGDPSDTLMGFVDQLGQIEMIINELLSGKLNNSRKLILNESLGNIERLQKKHLSADSKSQNKDQIKIMLDLDEDRTKRLYDV